MYIYLDKYRYTDNYFEYFCVYKKREKKKQISSVNLTNEAFLKQIQSNRFYIFFIILHRFTNKLYKMFIQYLRYTIIIVLRYFTFDVTLR